MIILKIDPNQPYRILVLDDHSLYSEGLKRIISDYLIKAVITSYTSIKDLKSEVSSFEKVDLLISDIELPEEDIFEFVQQLKTDKTDLAILVISMHKKLSVIRKCLNAGVQGYILKDEDQLLQPAISSILSGKSYYSSQVMTYYEQLINQEFDNISTREDEIIKLLCQGYGNQTIADQLFISVETLKTHKKNIKRKVGYADLHELIEFAKKRMLL